MTGMIWCKQHSTIFIENILDVLKTANLNINDLQYPLHIASAKRSQCMDYSWFQFRRPPRIRYLVRLNIHRL